MASIPVVRAGFFLVRKPRKAGGWLYSTFPIRDKAYYIGSGWQEISSESAIEQGKPIVPPTVEPPERLVKQSVPIEPKAKKGRPKKSQK